MTKDKNQSVSSSSSESNSLSSDSSGRKSEIASLEQKHMPLLQVDPLKKILLLFQKKLEYLDAIHVSENSNDTEIKALVLTMIKGYSSEWKTCPYRNCFDHFRSFRYKSTFDDIDKLLLHAFILRVHICSGKLIRDYESISK